MTTSVENQNKKQHQTPLRILATFYFQPTAWFSKKDNHCRTFNSNLLIYKDEDYNNEASVVVCINK